MIPGLRVDGAQPATCAVAAKGFWWKQIGERAQNCAARARALDYRCDLASAATFNLDTWHRTVCGLDQAICLCISSWALPMPLSQACPMAAAFSISEHAEPIARQ
jgi:hypothetical protein